ncbi:glycerophosphodiester phosphodiesterase [Liquorilactobacillus aquaticus DSM 21051]|uniref:Glycerophosphodiester phosphodiesterase n=1 Tax=Liquorilactobacillus aquaticus DSM 21051 TaxID=1423725 RepID=A0A0R2D9D3_9LACO|nr:glycerophosphodiester phosphodiesterase family protein [Liquorilactobacillus aquaticus]KRM97238.1 glycerophosphodiester phosphodiesterase [Liquorilactobacillus aquaticus DSM 21051]
MLKHTLIFGHRGYPQKFPENSLAGFKYSIQHQIDGLEFDVHLTKDNIPVIMHDETIDRTTDGNGEIHSYTFSELRKFKLKNSEPIPSLAELLDIAAYQPIHLNLEFKTDKNHYAHIEEIVLNMVKKAALNFPVIFSSFNLETLKTCHRIDPNQQYCWLTEKKVPNAEKFVKETGLSGLHLPHYQQVNVPQRLWTIDDAISAQKIFETGVDGLITDDFEQMRALQNKLYSSQKVV